MQTVLNYTPSINQKQS